MKINKLKTKLIVLLTVLSTIFSFAQTDCELQWSRFTKDVDISTEKGKALIEAIDHEPETITSWLVFDTIGEEGLRVNLEELSFVTSHIKTKSKSADVIIDGINNVGSYSKWKGTIESSKDVENFYTIERALKSKDLVQEYNLMNYAAGANIDEIAAIHRYTVNNFELTVAAYGGGYSNIQQSWINLIESGLNKMRTTKEVIGTVYRGSNLEPQYLQPYIDAWESSSKIKTEPPFLSSSKDPLVAADFIERFGKNKPNSIEVTFVINKKTGVYIDDISDYGKNLCSGNDNCFMIQQEVLLNRNLTYKINDIPEPTINTENGKKQYIIYMTEL